MIKQDHFQTKEKSVGSEYKKLHSLSHRVEKNENCFQVQEVLVRVFKRWINTNQSIGGRFGISFGYRVCKKDELIFANLMCAFLLICVSF